MGSQSTGGAKIDRENASIAIFTVSKLMKYYLSGKHGTFKSVKTLSVKTPNSNTLIES